MLSSSAGKARILSGAMSHLCPTLTIDLFTFVINGIETVSNSDQALALPPTIHTQLSADYPTRSFII
jgi:hypothetical protein